MLQACERRIVRQAAVHAYQRLNAVCVCPDIVNHDGIVAADQGQLAEKEFLAPFNRTPNRDQVGHRGSRER